MHGEKKNPSSIEILTKLVSKVVLANECHIKEKLYMSELSFWKLDLCSSKSFHNSWLRTDMQITSSDFLAQCLIQVRDSECTEARNRQASSMFRRSAMEASVKSWGQREKDTGPNSLKEIACSIWVTMHFSQISHVVLKMSVH